MNKVNVALIQHSCGADPHTNFAKALDMIKAAAMRGAQIISTQELFKSRYFCQTESYDFFNLAEPVAGNTSTIQQLSRVARKHRVVIVAGLFEKRGRGVYHNTAAVIDADGSYLGKYRKMHIPDDPQYYEKFYFSPGDLGFKVFKTRYANIGVLICWDQWYPEAARLAALQGADILIYPTAIGWLAADKKEYREKQLTSWEIIQRSHAVANGCYVASANRVGLEPNPERRKQGIEFWGQSFIADPYGMVLKKGSSSKDEIVMASLDLDLIDRKRVMWPFLRDRRIDAYNAITKRFNTAND